MQITDAIEILTSFRGASLARTVGGIEQNLRGQGATQTATLNAGWKLDTDLLTALAFIKSASAQIDVMVHAVGILWSLPHILRAGERVETASIGAGNSNSGFDLTTNLRIAEFKFIHWQPKGNAVREKTLFADFVKLASAKDDRERYLYLLNSGQPLRFLQGNRNIEKALDRNADGFRGFGMLYEDRFRTVGEFYREFKDVVHVVSLIGLVPGIERLDRLVGSE